MRATPLPLLPFLALLTACAASEAPDLAGGDPGPGDVPADARPDGAADLPGDARPDAPAEDPGGDAADAGDAPPADLAQDPGADPAGDPGPGDPGPQDPGGDPGPKDPGPGDPGGDPGGPVYPPGTPLLDRTPEPLFDCAVDRSTTNHAGRFWSRGTPALLAPVAGAVVLGRVEVEGDSPWGGGQGQVRLSTMAPDGTLGAPVDVAPDDGNAAGLVLAPRGGGLLVAWSDGSTVRTAARDADLKPLSGPRALAGTKADWSTKPRLAPLGDAFGLAWGEPVGDTGRRARFARLDADGALAGTPLDIPVPNGSWEDPIPQPAAGGGRFGILWRESSGNRGQVWFTAVAPDGTVAVARRRVSATDEDGVTVGGGNWGQAALSLVASGDGWLAAWPETRAGTEGWGQGTTTVVKVARLDADGLPLEEAPVRSPVADVAETDPLLLPFRGAVGLFWTSGAHIYICGGCFPDNRMDFVLLDPARLVPRGPVLSLPNGPGGVLDVAAAAAGDDLPVAFLLGYHVHQAPASGWISCSAR